MMELQLIFPERSEDVLSEGLRWLTARACNALDEDGSGGLGGEFGYGVDYENDTFVMRRYYWGDCTCGDDDNHTPECAVMLPNFVHKPSGFTVRWYKWIGRDNEVEGNCDLATALNECAASLPTLSKDKIDG